MAGSEFLLSLGLWFLRAFVSSLICLAIGIVGIKSITVLTTKIKEFESIKGNALATSLFVGGFLFMLAWLFTVRWLIHSFFRRQ